MKGSASKEVKVVGYEYVTNNICVEELLLPRIIID
jgi:hypothetical protein